MRNVRRFIIWLNVFGILIGIVAEPVTGWIYNAVLLLIVLCMYDENFQVRSPRLPWRKT